MRSEAKQVETHKLREQAYGCWGRRIRGRDRELVMNIYAWLYLK